LAADAVGRVVRSDDSSSAVAANVDASEVKNLIVMKIVRGRFVVAVDL